jgi:hypothetical protein
MRRMPRCPCRKTERGRGDRRGHDRSISAAFQPSCDFDKGGRLIRINPREPQVPSSVDVGLALGSLDALRSIDLAMEDFAGG